ncbi:CFI-box-CTERM domain-containing protein [Treponema zioleckii]|uniref:CFI-box-CTERM domain-containing protein n=1 Tax=Treponema zioleckii TaxID=331680 RepID=UPI00168BFD88|nr:CFI-box-CTERM domain-containing protein [Treponema zioleckii]
MNCDWCGDGIPEGSTARNFHIYDKDKKFIYYSIFCSGKCKSDWINSDCPDIAIHKAKRGSCFITTATIKSRNLPDNCHELEVLRNFRDSFMNKDDCMKREVEEYYIIAPKICANIDKEKNAPEIYEEIYQKWIKPAVESCEAGDKEKTHDIYKSMVLKLKEKYLN